MNKPGLHELHVMSGCKSSGRSFWNLIWKQIKIERPHPKFMAASQATLPHLPKPPPPRNKGLLATPALAPNQWGYFGWGGRLTRQALTTSHLARVDLDFSLANLRNRPKQDSPFDLKFLGKFQTFQPLQLICSKLEYIYLAIYI